MAPRVRAAAAGPDASDRQGGALATGARWSTCRVASRMLAFSTSIA